ncbi:MAG: h16 [Rhodospirillales bacterium]|nr:h16 [Rhodospirillales bacterium]
MSPKPLQIRSIDIEIDAPDTVAWDVLVDFANYARWNSFTPKIDTDLPLGDPLGTQLKLWVPSMKGTEPVDVVTHYFRIFDRPRHLAWEHPPEAASPHLTRRDQHLEALSPNRCRYYSTDTFLGDTAEALYSRHGVWVQRGLDTVAIELKEEAERIAHSTGG